MDIYDREGNPITIAEWVGLKNTNTSDYAQVAFDTINGVDVSTVWLGLDHNYHGGPPVIFETMTFTSNKDGEWANRCWRYSTESEALAGHEAICAQLRTGLDFIIKEANDPEI